MSRSKEAWADDPFDTWNADAPLQQERNDIADLGTDYRDLPPDEGDGDPGCPVCLSTNGFTHLHGERYECQGCGEVFSAQEIGK